MMKKMITILLSFTMVLCLAACGNSAAGNDDESSIGEDAQTENDAEGSAEVQGSDTQTEAADESENADAGGTEEAGISETQQPETEVPETQGSKVLVAYFSATGTTKGVAEHIANGLQADIYEIIPEEPYTDADLDYGDNNSRSTIEMNDASSRPAISGSVENMEQYDVVFIGYAGGIIGLN